jgi:hypothetical protein
MRLQRRVQFQVQKEFNKAKKTPTPEKANPEVHMYPGLLDALAALTVFANTSMTDETTERTIWIHQEAQDALKKSLLTLSREAFFLLNRPPLAALPVDICRAVCEVCELCAVCAVCAACEVCEARTEMWPTGRASCPAYPVYPMHGHGRILFAIFKKVGFKAGWVVRGWGRKPRAVLSRHRRRSSPWTILDRGWSFFVAVVEERSQSHHSQSSGGARLRCKPWAKLVTLFGNLGTEEHGQGPRELKTFSE